MDLGLAGRVALVMGASTGLGREVALTLAREGARVAISSRSQERLDSVIEAAGDAEMSAFAADTSDPAAVAALPGAVEEAMGPIEILVLNTGGPPPGLALDAAADTWRTAYQSLVLAPLELAKACVPGMKARGWGRIVNVAATSVKEPIPGLTLSNANRAAATGLLNTLAREVAADGITVNTIATGRFATDRLAQLYGSLGAAEEQAKADVPASRLGEPQEFADLTAFLCSERAAYITGAVIPIDGGLTRGS